MLPNWLVTVRAQQWAGQKLGPVLAVFFAGRVFEHRSIAASWIELAQLVIAIAAGAVWVSLLNDLTDRGQDRAASKANRLEGKAPAFIALALALPALVGAGFAIAWRDDPALVTVFGTTWLVFASYSLPPVRLKERGLAGVLADATGAHLLPAMIALLLAYRANALPPDPRLLGAVALWSGGFGLRGILWHQLMDRASDARAGVATFVVRRGPKAAVRLARWVALPIELCGLAALLFLLGAPLIALMLALYGAIAILRIALAGAHYTIVQEVPNYRLLLGEFYDLLFPMALLLVSVLAYPRDAIVLLACAVLAMPRLASLAAEGWAIVSGGARRLAGARRKSL